MFEALSERFESAWKKLRGQDKISEANVQEALRDVRRALLEADVNLQVVKTFVADVQEKALGADVISGVNPGQQFIKIVNDELTKLMGETNSPLSKAETAPTVILMAGLQGTGKTTATAKLALHLRKESRSTMMVATDVYRPAAVDQLITLGNQIDVPVFDMGTDANPVEIARQGIEKAKEAEVDTVIVDTAGRLQIDPTMMAELAQIKEVIDPDEVLLVVDAMTGQEAANLTRTFHEQIGITGAILTKMDGDARGGAALSVRQISGKPIKFIGVGEKVEALQPFYPDRMASRILGMGDVLTLVEKAQESVDIADAEKLQAKILEAKFDFDDFLKQTRLMKNMGSLGGIMKMIPGMAGKLSDDQLQQGETQLRRVEAMINSMTKEERKNPELLSGSPSRRRRIARGAGYQDKDVSKLVSDFQKMRSMMQQMGSGQMGFPGMGGGFPGMGGMPGMGGGGFPGMGGMPGMGGAQPGFRGYPGMGSGKKKKKKGKKKKGFGEL
ncbi:signal recognition particle protein [Oscillatoria sp. CS-180]|uniref:signal recognition particle protein n=1 Tax=Oscillatoria sp. CS-180 TaxID=3021720 RepID=UPI00232F2BAC|nr:signal recognition particle protein [Oscillatoria sp. CS-180]MDB9529904.1 signal recognition particle protein [Oscillatoria sp. CS-180]